MLSDKVLKILSIVIIPLSIIPIVLINYISRGNFIAGPVLMFLGIGVISIQVLLTIFISAQKNQKTNTVLFIINLIGTIFCYYLLYRYYLLS